MIDSPFEARPLTPRVGAQIWVDAATLLSGVAATQIRRLLEERGVICMRDARLTDDQQLQFARTLGTISDESETGILKVSTNPLLNANSTLADYQRASFTWHFDGYGRDVPFLATMLTPRGLAASGGETEIANTYAAFDDLSDDEQRYFETLRVVHNFETAMRTVSPWPSYAELQVWQRQPTLTHPLVWTHRSGRKSLVLGHSASHVEGMDLGAGRALLCRLCEWATQPQYVYRHAWRMGDLVIWDNTGVLHRVVPYPRESARLMHRTTLVGEERLSVS